MAVGDPSLALDPGAYTEILGAQLLLTLSLLRLHHDQKTSKEKRPKQKGLDTATTTLSTPKGPISTRLSKAEKETLAKSNTANTALFVSLPKSLVKRRKQALDYLQKTILQSLDSYKLRSQSIIRSSNSYVAVVFGTRQEKEHCEDWKRSRSLLKGKQLRS
ncbi:hypothetical protein TESG_07318 [Trichophyton tonsurans CBS 112818]|uniref:Uncharacterized protein n=1 Tax=Trichophyton tonsurans (strain CBS 112818) TaxID=647933 RepID=F2S8U1_TRIT1|nr:hypothetical protein TESG_07318 [Trichophyton tonsurans CBS 112818]